MAVWRAAPLVRSIACVGSGDGKRPVLAGAANALANGLLELPRPACSLPFFSGHRCGCRATLPPPGLTCCLLRFCRGADSTEWRQDLGSGHVTEGHGRGSPPPRPPPYGFGLSLMLLLFALAAAEQQLCFPISILLQQELLTVGWRGQKNNRPPQLLRPALPHGCGNR
jgi:hypothetical protein